MSFLDKYKIDKDHAVKGIKFELDDKNYITLAYAGPSNPAYAQSIQHHLGTVTGKSGKMQKLSVEEDREKLARVYSESIVIGWGGPEFPSTCNPTAVINFFVKYPEFFREVQELAGEMQHYLEEQIEDAVGN